MIDNLSTAQNKLADLLAFTDAKVPKEVHDMVPAFVKRMGCVVMAEAASAKAAITLVVDSKAATNFNALITDGGAAKKKLMAACENTETQIEMAMSALKAMTAAGGE